MTELATASASSTAPAAAFFARWGDVATWPDWNTDTEWVRLDGPFLAGVTGTLKPKGGPKVRFTVATLTDHEFVDVSSLPGAALVFAHTVTVVDGRTRLEVTISMNGPLRWVWTRVMGKGLRASVQRDLEALVAVAEADVAAVA